MEAVTCPLNFSKDIEFISSCSEGGSSSDFIKSFQFSPDGNLGLSATECGSYLLTHIPSEVVTQQGYYCTSNERVMKTEITEFSRFSAGESINDFKWYPGMNSNDLASCCFVSTTRDHPIHLWDIYGNCRSSYKGHNQLDELDVAASLSFNLAGDKFYAGSNRMIRCHDISYPGESSVRFATSKTRRSSEGQKGIISCIAFNPDYSGCFAAGSYANSVNIYLENTHASVLEICDLEFGVTYLRWSPCGNMLWVGGRKHNDVICWDVRHTRSEVGRISRYLNTNQRMTFDIDPWGKYLATGTQDNKLLVYETSTFELVKCQEGFSDCVNAVQFHPYSATLGISTGQRHFPTVEHCSSSDDDDDDGGGDNDNSSKSSIHMRGSDNDNSSKSSIHMRGGEVAEERGSGSVCSDHISRKRQHSIDEHSMQEREAILDMENIMGSVDSVPRDCDVTTTATAGTAGLDTIGMIVGSESSTVNAGCDSISVIGGSESSTVNAGCDSTSVIGGSDFGVARPCSDESEASQTTQRTELCTAGLSSSVANYPYSSTEEMSIQEVDVNANTVSANTVEIETRIETQSHGGNCRSGIYPAGRPLSEVQLWKLAYTALDIPAAPAAPAATTGEDSGPSEYVCDATPGEESGDVQAAILPPITESTCHTTLQERLESSDMTTTNVLSLASDGT